MTNDQRSASAGLRRDEPKTKDHLPPAAEQVFLAAEAAIRATRERAAGPFAEALRMIRDCRGKIVFTGMGKSGLAARKMAATFASTGSPAFFLNAADALHGDLGMVGGEDLVVMLSNNAGAVELVTMLPSLRRMGAQVLGIFGRTDTELARGVDLVLPAKAPKEGCPLDLAPMASTLAALVLGDALAAALMAERGFTPEDFALRHPGGSLGRRLLLTAADVMRRGEELPLIGEAATLREVVTELTRSNLGGVCVTDEREFLTGFVSDGDVRRALMQDDPFALKASDIMTPSPVSVAPATRLGDLLDLMENPQRRIYVVPVVEEGKVQGIVRMHDIVG